MGHRSRSTYTRYYIPRFIDRDCMAINLSMPLRKDVVRAVGRLARDEQAPTRLTDAQKFEVINDARLLELCHQRDTYKRQIKDLGFHYVKDAKGENELYERHRTKNDEIKNLKQQMKNLRLTKAIDEFHNTINTIEINRQLEGFMPKEEVLAPSNIEYELEERGTVAKLYIQDPRDEPVRCSFAISQAMLTFSRDKHEKLLSKIENNTDNGPEILQRLKDIEKALKIRPAAVQQWDDDFVAKDVLKTTPKHSYASKWSENEEADDDEDDEGWEDLPRTGSRIPEHHTSPISRIGLWKSVKNVIGDIDPDYTLVAEENRGVLRPYSMGGESDCASDTASHTLGGQFGGGGMRSLTADSRISLPNNHQGIKGALKLGLESSTVYRLLNIYKRHINIKCPLFFDYELDSLVEGFLKSINAASSMSKDEIGRQQLMRKRSDDRVRLSNNTSSCSEVPQGSAEHAIVLVILALGEVCGHKESVNFPQKGSSGGPIHFQRGYPSPEEIDYGLRPSSAEEDVPQTARSLAVTPGLTYFTAATDIVGKHFGSNTLRYVQLNIVASFYLGQLTRVSQCQAYLHEATRALRVISRR